MGGAESVPALTEFMQAHLHVGRKTWRRTARGYLVLATIPLFFLIFGFPYMRGDTANVNGQKLVGYDCFFVSDKEYAPNPRYNPPLFILVPIWLPHHNADGMQWLADTNSFVQGGTNQ